MLVARGSKQVLSSVWFGLCGGSANSACRVIEFKQARLWLPPESGINSLGRISAREREREREKERKRKREEEEERDFRYGFQLYSDDKWSAKIDIGSDAILMGKVAPKRARKVVKILKQFLALI